MVLHAAVCIHHSIYDLKNGSAWPLLCPLTKVSLASSHLNCLVSTSPSALCSLSIDLECANKMTNAFHVPRTASKL